jgi:GTP cyclohydrolase FolE2
MIAVNSICPICQDTNLVDISECLIRDTDIVLHENEDYKHVQRGRLQLLAHTRHNVELEHELPSSYCLEKVA